MKICKKCNIEQNLDSFYKDKRMVEGIKNICKSCDLERMKNYGRDNKNRIKQNSKNHYNKNKEKCLQYNKEWREKQGYDSEKQKLKNQEYNKKNPGKKKQYYWDNIEDRKECSKEYYKNNREKSLNYNKEYEKLNKEKTRKYRNNYVKKRYKEDINFKLIHNLRGRINSVLKKQYVKKDNNSIKYVGCSLDNYKDHIQNQFLPMFTWENHGIIWEIDHIQPCVSFDFSIEENIYKCFNYKNTMSRFKTTEIAKQFGSDQIGNREKGDKTI